MMENPFEQKSGVIPPENEPNLDPREYMERLREGGHASISAEEREQRIIDLMGFRKIPRVEAEQLIDEQMMVAPDMTRLRKESKKKAEKKAETDPELAKMKAQQAARKKAWKARKGERDAQT